MPPAAWTLRRYVFRIGACFRKLYPGVTRTMVGDPVDLLGWGRLGADDDDYPVKLQMAELVVQPTRDCGPDHANTVELCVGDPEDEQNAASGDSGGPLFITNEQNAYEQIGLVSRGSTYIDDATDVVALRGWIDAEIAAWGRTTLTDCGACESALDAKLGKTNGAEACWVQCLAKYVEDHFDESRWSTEFLPRRPRRSLDHGMKSGSEERSRYLCTECRLSQTVSKWNTGLST